MKRHPHPAAARARTASNPSRGGPSWALADAIAQRAPAALVHALAHLGDAGAPDVAPLRVARAAQSQAPALLAAAHPGPAAARAEAQALYQRCLDHYRHVVRAGHDELGDDDVGAALAYFVAVNLHALSDLPIAPAMLAGLQRQMAALLAATPAWSGAGLRERQAYFEQAAILGVLVAETAAQARTQAPAAMANVQAAARGYLQQVIGLDDTAITLGACGLEARRAVALAA